MNEIKINGTQKFMGIDIPIVEGGFGKNCRIVSAKSISEIHHMRLSDVNASINRLIKRNRIKEGIDYINLLSETVSLRKIADKLDLVSSNRAKDAFILSERGYSKLIKSMDDDESWNIMDEFIDEYFTMRQVINSNEQLKANYLLAIYNGGQDAVIASKKLTEIEVKEATAPLIEKNDSLNNENNLLAQKNLEWADRPLINSLVRAYAGAIGNNYGKAWTDFKKELLYKHSINLNSRITNYLNTSGKKTKPKTLDMLDDSEISSAISTIVSMCRENEIDIDHLLNNKAS